jgi:putative alpha-1,2-mannosidase
MYVDGKPWDKNFLRYDDLMNGMLIEIEMRAEPNRQRGTGTDALPYSYSKDDNPDS